MLSSAVQIIILPKQNYCRQNTRVIQADYWEKRVMAPSCLMYYVGLNKKLKKCSASFFVF